MLHFCRTRCTRLECRYEVAIVSIAKHVTQDKCQLAAEYIKMSGLHLVDLNDTMLPRKGMFSGSDEQRTKILQLIQVSTSEYLNTN